MAQVFYSFHYDGDRDRVAQVRNMGVVEGSPVASDNDWEQIKRGGDAAIQRWIDQQMKGTRCCIVLIGQGTAKRKWVEYEIVEAWNQNKGVLGIHIHNLRDLKGYQSSKGMNPLSSVTLRQGGQRLSEVAHTYDPPFFDSKAVYAHIRANLSNWIDEAIRLRQSW